MNKVLVVDDEFYFRQGFKKMIPWGKYGYEVYAEAKNGKEALDIISASKPDLLFLDISMPIMNGIELMKYLYENEIKIPVVLLTGYSEFEYAKQAIKYGASEYLLKPVETNEVCELLERMSKMANDNRNLIEKPDNLTRGIIKDKLFMDLVNGDFNIEKKKLFSQIAEISLAAPSYFIAVFQIVKSEDWSPADLSLWKFGVSNIIQEMMSMDYCCRLFSIDDTRICGVLWDNNGSNSLEVNVLRTKCTEVAKTIYDSLGIKIYTGIGSECSEVSQIRASYNQAEEAVESKLLFDGSVILYSDISSRSNLNVFGVDEKRHLLSSLFLYDKESISKIANTVFTRIKATDASMNVVKNVISEFSSILAEAEQHIPNIRKASEIRPDLHDKIMKCSTLDDVRLLMEQFLIDAAEKIIKSRPAMSSSQRLVEKAKDYIEHEYYRIDLNANHIAKNMYVSRNYLCAIFKKITGSTIGKYIDAVRAEKAKEMFKAGNTVIQCVSDKVGFRDPNYFSKFFKKQTGMTPSQYINTLK